ncbi:MAG: hypothetical protein HWE21_15280 [Cytophagia bacterium]|nr:hypothetical protein [Cytophagia bacterium]NVK85686.1 hypothetical protein [Cytophagia bacterium]
MNSLVINNWNSIKRRLILVVGILVAIGATVFAHEVEEAKLSEKEAHELIGLIKEELEVEKYTPTYIFDEEGMMEEVSPLSIIKIYDANDVLLLEAPITKLRQYKNKHLRKLLNASDFLTEYGNSKYYRLDI